VTEGTLAVFHASGQPFELRRVPVPEPGRGEILVRVDRCDICGSDLHMWRGDVSLADFGVTWPVAMGHEMVGRIEAMGPGVSADSAGRPLHVGDRLVWSYYYPCGRCRACLRGQTNACPTGAARMMTPVENPPHFYGGFAQYYVIPARATVLRPPDDLPDEVLTPLNCALCQVLFSLQESDLRMGESVVVQGCGGLGLFACALAREIGAAPVIAIDRIPSRLQQAGRFGATDTIDASAIDDPRQRAAEVMRLTEGWGADVVVEVAGVPEVVPEGIRMLARYGRYLEVGNISPRRTYKADPSLLVGQNRRIIGVSFYRAETLRVGLDFLARTRDRYPYGELVSHDFALERIDEAFSAADAMRAETSVVRAAITPWT
jgi:threonine dehydrogenase-like Zn-dependent dehydrogenase